ncbi:MAG: ATP-dependent helicase HrpB [Hyphomicrobiaceae bacterium]|jgi:ATP-dependent helicase HrpB
MSRQPLPIDAAIPDLRLALGRSSRAVLVAPPGAGKTTRVPLELLDEPWLGRRRIIMLEPRRLAARAAAERLAHTLSEKLGRTIGLRARLMTQTSAATRIEVITEGVFTRMILDDPELTDVGLVIFDEFHERSLDADFGLALALDAQQGLRDDLRILVMSATLDGARVADALGTSDAPCPVVSSEGRSFPVETHYLGRDPASRLEDQVARAVTRALRETAGSILVFLPGQGEIRRAERKLSDALPPGQATIAPLYGGMDRDAQDAAIAPPAPGQRKIILATAIAETSLTLDGIEAVVDAGLAREPRYDVGARLTRLATVRVSRAGADQRRGRAGRLGPGHCYRLWAEPETQSLTAYATPEILSSDLTGLLLDCAAWGVTDAAMLTWLDPPPAAGIAAARSDLEVLGALDAQGRITSFGNAIRALPLPPTLAAMICHAAHHGHALAAAQVAALLVERGLGGNSVDLDDRLERFSRDRGQRARAMRTMAARWAQAAEMSRTAEADKSSETDAAPATANAPLSTAALLSLAFPDRIAKSRGATTDGHGGTRYLMASGSGGFLAEDEPLAGVSYLVVADLQGAARAGRITSAAKIDEAELANLAAGRVEERIDLAFDRVSLSVRAKRQRRLGALVLESGAVPLPDDESVANALAHGIAAEGIAILPWSKAQHQLRARVGFLAKTDPTTWPDLSDDTLGATIETWLAPFLSGKSAVREIATDDLGNGLGLLLDWSQRQVLDQQAPTHFTAPTGNNHAIAYSGEHAPCISLRAQELYGLKVHPAIDAGRLLLTLFLLSPAARPIQVTRDLPGFWSGSWAGVRAELRGRYPKHPWPEDPANAEPTARVKRRS